MDHIYKNSNFGENWFYDGEKFYRDIVKKYPTGSHFVEVGCWKGKSSAYMAVEIANSGKKIKFDCIDTWNPFINPDANLYKERHKEDSENLYQIFINNMKPLEELYTPIRTTSIEGSKLYADESLDFVFIDACHYYECVKEDISAWYPKIKKGGILAGHDFSKDWPGVEQAVRENFLNFKVLATSCTWYTEKE